MRTSLILILAISFTYNLLSQKYDYLWMLGDPNAQMGRDSFGITFLDFRDGDSLKIYANYNVIHGFNTASVSMCDVGGNYLFSSNGSRIYDATYGKMQGGENINPFERGGYRLRQGVLTLPHPRDSNIYAFFHGRKGYITKVTQTWYSEINMRENEGLGAVKLMNNLVQDTLVYGQMTAVKHGNGRDWWIPLQHYCRRDEGCSNNIFYQSLLTSDRVTTNIQKISDTLIAETGLGQAVFTPDGTKYIVPYGIQAEMPIVIDIYDFDRCTGQFGTRQQVQFQRPLDGSDRGSALAISPNSRFIYLIMWTKIIQYDLWAEDIKASETVVAEYDGFADELNSFALPTRFLFGQLAPDGKIYINTTNGTRYLHVIHHPNEKGLSCNVEQHAIKLPTYNNQTLPNHPNYKLGAWEGSPCDTLKDMVSTTNTFEKVSVKLYPNPAVDVLNVELETATPYKKMEVQIYDVLGKQVGTFINTNSLTLDYPAGLYIVQILIDQKLVKTEKLVIER